MSHNKLRPNSEDVVSRRPVKVEIPRHVSCDAVIPPEIPCDIPEIYCDEEEEEEEKISDSERHNSNSPPSHRAAHKVAQRLSQRAKQRARRLSVRVIELYDRVHRLHVHHHDHHEEDSKQ